MKEKGLIKVKDLKVGDRIMGFSGKAVTVESVIPLAPRIRLRLSKNTPPYYSYIDYLLSTKVRPGSYQEKP